MSGTPVKNGLATISRSEYEYRAFYLRRFHALWDRTIHLASQFAEYTGRTAFALSWEKSTSMHPIKTVTFRKSICIKLLRSYVTLIMWQGWFLRQYTSYEGYAIYILPTFLMSLLAISSLAHQLRLVL